ncbi:MAG: hypothetical protein AABY00_01600 [Nanoarchaeota archaeon]
MVEQTQGQPQTSKDELIGFHKGSLSTLIAERNELLRIIQITENLIGAHAKELEGLGVKLQSAQAEEKK